MKVESCLERGIDVRMEEMEILAGQGKNISYYCLCCYCDYQR